jgi:hypothetical protein
MNVNENLNEKYQTISLSTAVASGEYWSINDINELRAMKAAKMTAVEIARALGRTYYSVGTKLTELGLTKKQSKPRQRKVNNIYSNPLPTCDKCFLLLSATVHDC